MPLCHIQYGFDSNHLKFLVFAFYYFNISASSFFVLTFINIGFQIFNFNFFYIVTFNILIFYYSLFLWWIYKWHFLFLACAMASLCLDLVFFGFLSNLLDPTRCPVIACLDLVFFGLKKVRGEATFTDISLDSLLFSI